jgi:hypothetical protein
MIRKTLLILMLCLLLTVPAPVSVQAENGLAVVDDSVMVDFPLRIDFNVAAASDTDILDIRLHYQVERMSYAQVTSEVSLQFIPARTVEASWSWDMRRIGGLPPGSKFAYWWSVADASGERIETDPVTIAVEDNRYSWQSLSEGMITLYWYEGDQSFARELMDVARQALVRLADFTGAAPERPIRIYIYATSADLQGAMIFPQEWTGGVAFTRFGVLAIGIPPNRIDWGRRAMTHEMTHLVIHQATFNPYNDLPTWLSEGIAMYAEGELEAPYTTLLERATNEGGLISVRSLSSPFSAYARESALSYAESYSIVDYLIASYGPGSMLELLETFRQGTGYDEALQKVYGFDMDGLDGQWRAGR